jgi:hypothetical protein
MKLTKSKTVSSSKKIAASTMTPLMAETAFQVSKDSIRFPKKAKGKFDSEKTLIEKIEKFAGLKATMITDYLLLSAKAPFVQDKGYINAINCQAVWPSDPHIDFPWWSPQYQSLPTAGKLEIWLMNLTSHQNLTVELRVSGYSYNSNTLYEVRSSLTPGSTVISLLHSIKKSICCFLISKSIHQD